MSGHDPAPYKVATFVICGVLAGLAGSTFLLRLNVGSPIAGIGYELTAIAAVIIGGTSFTGGKGSVIGTFFGVCLLQVLSTGLQLMGVEDNYKTIIIGLVVCCRCVRHLPAGGPVVASSDRIGYKNGLRKPTPGEHPARPRRAAGPDHARSGRHRLPG